MCVRVREWVCVCREMRVEEGGGLARRRDGAKARRGGGRCARANVGGREERGRGVERLRVGHVLGWGEV